MGVQHSMLISPELWPRLLKPKMANFNAELKTINLDVKIAYYFDGYFHPIIGDLIEIGLDVLDPIQPTSMDPDQIKEEFGDQLCFWGSIDVQHTLPCSSEVDVRAEVLERLFTIEKNDGLIIGPTHYIQLDTPMENFWAFINTVQRTPYDSI